jgi:Heparinase II/III-like protein/Heparinase II/III N-terminus
MTLAIKPGAVLGHARRRLGRFLRSRMQARQDSPAQPTFGEDQFFAHLKELQAATEAWSGDPGEAAWEAAITHFRERVPPLGFLSSERVPALLADVGRRFPTWRERLLAKVHRDRREGLGVYDRRAAPLEGPFDWSGAGAGPLEDNLYGSRPHRFGFLPRWALACHYDRTVIAALERVLGDWMMAPRQHGNHPAYRSSHVVVYHFVALLLAWPFLAVLEEAEDGAAVAALRRKALLILYEDSRFLSVATGQSVPNNHLLAEYFANWAIAALLPEFDHAAEPAEAEAAWLAELERQVFDDGGSFEHSVHYQEHACELAVAYLLICRSNGWLVPGPARSRIERMLAFQLALAGPDLIPPLIGNTTEDPMLAMGVCEGWQSGFLREVQRACFAPEKPPAAQDDPTRETAFWLLGGDLPADRGEAEEEPPFQAFPASGFYLFSEPDSRARLTLRLGPSPDAPGIGGHSHGDLLSLSLRIGGAPVLAPPGTYSYRFKPHPELPGRPNLRAHFASASCRSGPFYEGLEPYGPLKGDFRNWQLPCHVVPRWSSSNAAGLSWVEGRVAGAGPYVDLCRGLLHVWGEYWLVYDRLPPGSREQRAFAGWQFAPGVTCRQPADDKVEAQAGKAGARLNLQACGTETGDIVTGGYEPLRGWVSPSYGRLEPAPNLRFPLRPDSRDSAFLLAVEPRVDQRLEQVVAESDSLGFRITAPGEDSLLLISVAGGPGLVQWGDVSFQGRLLCLKRGKQGLRVRALGLERLTAPSWGLELAAHEPADFELLLKEGSVLWPRGPSPLVIVGSHHEGT